MVTRQLLDSVQFLPKLNTYNIFYDNDSVGLDVSPSVPSTSSLWIKQDITLGASTTAYPSSLAWNMAYYTSSWRRVNTGYAGGIRYDPGTGYFGFQSTPTSEAANSTAALQVNMSLSPTGDMAVAGLVASNNLLVQGDNTNGYIRTTNGPSTLFLGCDNVTKWAINSSGFFPAVDNAFSVGSGSARASVIYAATGTINTSDETEKKWLGITSKSKQLAVANKIFDELGYYQWLDQIEAKGEDKARFHFGVRAQKIWKIVADEGLCAPLIDGVPDPAWEGDSPPAYLCYDELEDGGRFGIRPDQLNLFLSWAIHERLKLLEG